MIYKCVHGVITAEKYCADCNKKPALIRPGNSFGNRRPTIMKMDTPRSNRVFGHVIIDPLRTGTVMPDGTFKGRFE